MQLPSLLELIVSVCSVVQWTAHPINPGDQMQPGEKKGGPGFDSWLNQDLFLIKRINFKILPT